MIGAEDTYGANARHFEAREVIVKIGLKHEDIKALDIFVREFAHPAVAMAPGLTGALSGRPKPLPVLRVFSFLWPKAKVPVAFDLDGKTTPVEMDPATLADAAALVPHTAPAAPETPAATVTLTCIRA